MRTCEIIGKRRLGFLTTTRREYVPKTFLVFTTADSAAGRIGILGFRHSDGGNLRIKLPPAQLYTPDVKLRVVNRESGIFWRDENIVPEATEALKDRFVEAANNRQILAEARTNAVKLLSNMQDLAGNKN